MEVKKKTEGLQPRDCMNNLELSQSQVTISKPYDSSSLQLAGMMKGRSGTGSEREGVKFKSATISIDQQYIAESDKIANQILILKLWNGYVADISVRTSEAGAGAQIVETIKLSFDKFEVTYWYEDRNESGELVSTWRPCAENYASQDTVHGT
jgi:type VI protein secretion system component Hcp